jgi:hypothetical protein
VNPNTTLALLACCSRNSPFVRLKIGATVYDTNAIIQKNSASFESGGRNNEVHVFGPLTLSAVGRPKPPILEVGIFDKGNTRMWRKGKLQHGEKNDLMLLKGSVDLVNIARKILNERNAAGSGVEEKKSDSEDHMMRRCLPQWQQQQQQQQQQGVRSSGGASGGGFEAAERSIEVVLVEQVKNTEEPEFRLEIAPSLDRQKIPLKEGDEVTAKVNARSAFGAGESKSGPESQESKCEDAVVIDVDDIGDPFVNVKVIEVNEDETYDVEYKNKTIEKVPRRYIRAPERGRKERPNDPARLFLKFSLANDDESSDEEEEEEQHHMEADEEDEEEKRRHKKLKDKVWEKEQEKQDEEKQTKKNDLMDLQNISVIPGDYVCHIHIIEARDLKAKDDNGSSDPVVTVDAFGHSESTQVKKNCLSCVFDRTFSFELKNMTRESLQAGSINISCWDVDFFSKDLIGSFSTDFDTVYFHKDNKNGKFSHEIYRSWVALINNMNTGEVGTQGFLKISVSFLGPKDRPTFHDLDEELNDESPSPNMMVIM